MIQKSKLEDSLKYFAVVVERLLEKPLLESDLLERALDVNIASLRTLEDIELFEEESKNKDDYFEYAINYNQLIRLCLKEFEEMMPRLNGQAWHVDLYSEQMRGRIALINKIYSHRN